MNLYVIRHGETERNVKQLINGHNNGSLTKFGIKQAKEASKIIKKLKIDLIICSPLVRAKETCKYINVNNLEIIYDERIIERDSGDLEGEPISLINMNYWFDPNNEVIYKNSEGFKKLYKRISDFLEYLKGNYENKTILLVTHGDVCKAINYYFNPNITTEQIIAYEKNNCEIIKFTL